MRILRIIIPFFILFFIFVLLAEALPNEIVTIDGYTERSILLTFQNESWSILDNSIEMSSLVTNENGLPTHAVLLGVPTNAVNWRVIAAESTPVQIHFSFPERTDLVVVDSAIRRRDQPITQLTFNPVQQEADGVRVYTKITVELSWDALTSDQKPNHPVYEQLLAETLLNYDTLNRPAAQTAHVPEIQPRAMTTPTLRIVVPATGLYRLPFADLIAAGLPTDPTQLRLTNRSMPIATTVNENALLFFGEAYEDVYTDENIYWLTAGSGTQMQLVSQNHPAASAATQFATSVHLEENSFYWNTMPNGEGQDHWFWGTRISPNSSGLDTSRTYTVTLPTVTATPTVMVRVQLKGHTTLDHKTRISLNGTLIDEQLWQGQTVFTHHIPVTGSLLVAGDNVVTVEAADSGAVVDQLYINWLEIDYAASYAAIDDSLRFAPPMAGTFAFTVTEFTTDTIHLLDITNPHRPRQVAHNANNGTLNFQQTVTDATRFLATATVTVPQMELDSGSSWRDGGNSADWLIITHSDFIAPAQGLADHRNTQGLQTAVVDIQDVYDEFSDGLFNPEAIRDFLAHTYANWQAPAPTYVVLLGDGSQDYKDQLKSGSRNFVPPRMINTYDYGQIPSDHWYVTFAGDDIFEEMFVGRLSAETLSQANAIVDNIIAYETRSTPTDQLALFVTDDRESVFEYNSEQLINRLPDLFDVERIYTEAYTTATVTRDITQTMLSGATYVNYAGHGNYYRWGSYVAEGRGHRIFTEAHADVLANSGLNPFVTVADCLNGFFSIPSNLIIDPYDEALAEAFQRQPNGGAVAVWTDAGFGYVSEQRILMNAFYDALFVDQITTLGFATNVAKTDLYNSSSYWEQNVRTMTLFGDPATDLHIDESIPTSVRLKSSSYSASIYRQYIVILLCFSLVVTCLIYRNSNTNRRTDE